MPCCRTRKVRLPQDYHLAAALGAYLVAVDRPEQAVKAFLKAAELAVEQNAASHAAWARIRAAGVMLDAGRPADARPLLEAAATTDGPPTAFLSIHRAELLEADDQASAALRSMNLFYVNKTTHPCTPALPASPDNWARTSRPRPISRLRNVPWKAALEAGEIFPLEALASLYLDSPGHEQEAVRLATRNLEFKRDRSARETLEAAKKAAEAAAASPP